MEVFGISPNIEEKALLIASLNVSNIAGVTGVVDASLALLGVVVSGSPLPLALVAEAGVVNTFKPSCTILLMLSDNGTSSLTPSSSLL